MDATKILEMIDSQARATEGEVLELTGGEYDSYGLLAVVRVLRDCNLRILADAFMAQNGSWLSSSSQFFRVEDFLDYLAAEGAVERIQTRSVHVMDDSECVLATPVFDREPANDPEALPYEWAEGMSSFKAKR
jgi:hypothetical protein